MKNYEIKLNCPLCNIEFKTTRTDKIWCSISCSNKFRIIKNNINENSSIQQRHINKEKYRYNIDLNKWYLIRS
tara:strand:- start:50 stop:268 length:219 start_codon:yes stop_codon:yes gene_type:complete